LAGRLCLRARPSESGIAEQLTRDGVTYDPADLFKALELLENNGDVGYDTGALPGIPYRLLRPESKRQPSPVGAASATAFGAPEVAAVLRTPGLC
jgi:hypothetical protein